MTHKQLTDLNQFAFAFTKARQKADEAMMHHIQGRAYRYCELHQLDRSLLVELQVVEVAKQPTCQCCGKPFTPKNSVQKFCSNNCRLVNHRTT